MSSAGPSGEQSPDGAGQRPPDDTSRLGDSVDDEMESESSLLLQAPSKATCSVVEYYGPHVGDCGYCHRSPRESGMGRRSYDMDTCSLTPADYQELLDRGWRRSGCFCYRVNNQHSCCPNYTILCQATKFQLTRSHRKCIERVLSFLAHGGARGTRLRLNYSKGCPADATTWSQRRKHAKNVDELRRSSKLRDKRYLRSIERRATQAAISQDEAAECIRKKWEERMLTASAACDLPLESYLFPTKEMLDTSDAVSARAQARSRATAAAAVSAAAAATAAAPEQSFKPKHTLRVDMVFVDSKRCRAARDAQQRMLVRYQDAVHKDSHREWTMDRFCNFLVHTPIITQPLRDYDYLSEGANDHDVKNTDDNDEDDDDDDDDTLSVPVDSSPDYLLFQPPQLPTAYGSYHANYYLDDKLIATGVLDVLPRCITTVYFFYDPDFAHLNLGIFSALVEISMIRRMSKHWTGPSTERNQLVDYHLGMYVHECKKMHYKARFRPSYLLCSRWLCYVPTEECLRKLAGRKYADFAEGNNACDNEDYGDENDDHNVNEEEDEDDDHHHDGGGHGRVANNEHEHEHEDGQEGSGGGANGQRAGAMSREERKILQLLRVPVESPLSPDDTRMMSFLRELGATLSPEMVDLFANGYLSKYAELVGPKLASRMRLKVNIVYQSLRARHERLASRDE